MRYRLAAWLVTGPLGHGYAGCADALTLLWAAARRRSAGSREPGWTRFARRRPKT